MSDMDLSSDFSNLFNRSDRDLSSDFSNLCHRYNHISIDLPQRDTTRNNAQRNINFELMKEYLDSIISFGRKLSDYIEAADLVISRTDVHPIVKYHTTFSVDDLTKLNSYPR